MLLMDRTNIGRDLAPRAAANWRQRLFWTVLRWRSCRHKTTSINQAGLRGNARAIYTMETLPQMLQYAQGDDSSGTGQRTKGAVVVIDAGLDAARSRPMFCRKWFMKQKVSDLKTRRWS